MQDASWTTLCIGDGEMILLVQGVNSSRVAMSIKGCFLWLEKCFCLLL